MLDRLATACWGGALLMLPWIGVGVARLVTGRDLGAGLQPAYLLLALAMVCQALHLLRERALLATVRAAPRAWVIGAAACLTAVLLSGLGLLVAPTAQTGAEVWGRFAKQVVQLLIMGCFLLWAAGWTRGRHRWRLTVACLAAGLVVQTVYGLLQGVAYYRPLPVYGALETVFTSNPAILAGSTQLYLGDRFLDVPRLRGTAAEPLYLGNYLLLVWPWLLAGPLGGRLRRTLLVAAAGLLLATWSRGAWVGLLAQLGLWWWLSRPQRRSGPARPGRPERRRHVPSRRRWLLVAAGVLIVLIAAGLLGSWHWLLWPARRLAQSFSTQDWSNLTRLYSMQAAWRAWLLSPIVGVGWGQYAFHFPLLVDPMGLQSQFAWPVVNNLPLAVLCETGLLGFAVWSACGLGAVRAIREALSRAVAAGANDQPRRLVLACVAATGVAIQLLTFSQWNLPHIWVAPGLVLAALGEIRSRTNEDGRPATAPWREAGSS